MKVNYILTTKMQFKNKEDLLKKHLFKTNKNTKYYIDESNEKELLKITTLETKEQLLTEMDSLSSDFYTLRNVLDGDIKRSIYEYIENPLESEAHAVPCTDYVQLRYIQVQPNKYENYRAWRENTIFNFVKQNRNTIKEFGVYHSMISENPGVMFFSFFNDKQTHDNIFNSEEYKNILVEAGDNFIMDGTDSGLKLRTYKSLSMWNHKL